MAETNINMRFDETLEHYYRRLAKMADQRMVRLEQLTDPKSDKYDANYKGAKSWAYARASYDITQKWGGNASKPRFNTKPPVDKNALKAKINDIQEFLQAPTSTKSGITAGYKKKAAKFNKSQGAGKGKGIAINWEDWATYLDRYGAKLYGDYGSVVMNRVIKTVQSMAQADPDMSAEKLHHLALMRKNGGYQFNYVKVDGTDGGYDKLVDKAIHDIFRKRKDIEDIYRLLVGR